ncbi:FAD-dependent oxidoreductase [Gordonia rhizosphera]|uniref:FAD-binding domain-containing protein n=1 Tax=Gordonia rhizosphera NBRC 16068 TaxID=1108045 RepID=K6WHA7_9ACTN|nr:FAD-dependent monooxygenase [Gordonia rhizosphera]GAB91542.1 hypothetical protein GORHZ_136_00050 [Gordonia rhizosphera NBRC 16068]
MSTRVVVVGGSIGGLAVAAVLAPVVDEVVVIERADAAVGSVAPQGLLPHAMVMAGSVVLEELFDGFHASLLEQGAASGGPDPTRMPVYWHAAGVARRHLVLPDLGFPRARCGRRLIEPELRRRVRALRSVTVVQGVVNRGIRDDAGRLVGVGIKNGPSLHADLVIDATGRAGPFRRAVEVPEPPITEVGVDLKYTGFVIERHAADAELGELILVQNTPTLPRIGGLLPMDADRWQVILGGYFGDSPPTDPDGAQAFARTLADPVVAPFLERPFLEEPRRYTFRSSLRRRWDQVSTPGYVAVGDAVASFNPIYGQGMSSALLQAKALGEEVAHHGVGPGVEGRIAARLATVVNNPWTIATGGDFVYPDTRGRRPPGHGLVSRYIQRVMRASAGDDRVNAAWTEVQQLVAPPASLFRPAVMGRVLTRRGNGMNVAATDPLTYSVRD